MVKVKHTSIINTMDFLPDTQNRGLCMRRECREHFPRHRFQRWPLVSNPGMHHGTYVTHLPWCMSGSLTGGGGENVPGIPAHAQPEFSCIWQEAYVHPYPGDKRSHDNNSHGSDLVILEYQDRQISRWNGFCETKVKCSQVNQPNLFILAMVSCITLHRAGW